MLLILKNFEKHFIIEYRTSYIDHYVIFHGRFLVKNLCYTKLIYWLYIILKDVLDNKFVFIAELVYINLRSAIDVVSFKLRN